MNKYIELSFSDIETRELVPVSTEVIRVETPKISDKYKRVSLIEAGFSNKKRKIKQIVFAQVIIALLFFAITISSKFAGGLFNIYSFASESTVYTQNFNLFTSLRLENIQKEINSILSSGVKLSGEYKYKTNLFAESVDEIEGTIMLKKVLVKYIKPNFSGVITEALEKDGIKHVTIKTTEGISITFAGLKTFGVKKGNVINSNFIIGEAGENIYVSANYKSKTLKLSLSAGEFVCKI